MATKFDVDGNKVKGTKKKDIINWQNSSDWYQPLVVKAGKGNDTINFLKSAFNKNKLYGEAGKDKIIGSMKNDIIYGGSGNDTILGNSGNDSIHAGKGYDLVDGGSGKDKIWCDSGINAVSGGSKDDTIYGGVGYDAISGGSGNDEIKLQKGSKNYKSKTITIDKKKITLTEKLRTFVLAGTGHDKIYNIYGGAVIDGGSGNDTITAVSGNNTLKGGKGEDSITGGTGNDYIDGGDSADTIKGNAGKNTIYGGANTDYILGGTGNDYIDGGAANDTIKGGNGHDTIKGGTGVDSIDGGKGNDLIYGGSNEDSIVGGAGNDTIYGGTGFDTINAGAGINEIRYNKGDGRDTIISGGGDDTLVFEDNMTIKKGIFDSNGKDLIIKYTSDGTNYGWVTLKDFADGNHSVKNVVFESNTYTIDSNGEYIPVSESLYMSKSTPTLKADVAAWQADGNNGSADLSASIGDENQNSIPPVVAAFNN